MGNPPHPPTHPPATLALTKKSKTGQPAHSCHLVSPAEAQVAVTTTCTKEHLCEMWPATPAEAAQPSAQAPRVTLKHWTEDDKEILFGVGIAWRYTVIVVRVYAVKRHACLWVTEDVICYAGGGAGEGRGHHKPCPQLVAGSAHQS